MGCVAIRNKVQNFQNPQELKRMKTLDELDKNAAVDYALKNLKQQKYSQIEIIVSCSKLPNMDRFSLPNGIAVLYSDEKPGIFVQKPPIKGAFGLNDFEEEEEDEEADWMEKGRTEVRKGDPHPIFLNSIIFQSVNYQSLRLKVEIYAVSNSQELKKEHTNQINLNKCQFMGVQRFRMQELLNQGNYCTKQLLNPKKQKKEEQLKEKKTTVTIRYEEIEQTNSVVSLVLGLKLAVFSRNSFFYTVYRGRELGEFVQVYVSEKQKNQGRIKWDSHDFPLKELCRNDEDRQLKVEIYESNRKNNVKMLGATEFTLKEIISTDKKNFQISNKRTIFGELEVIKCQFQNRYTFLDYIHGGCDISLVVAMDFTMVNKPITDPKSLHYMNGGENEEEKKGEFLNEEGYGFRNQSPLIHKNKKHEELGNEYQEALKQTIKILDYYDTDCYIPFLGFGAKLPPYYNCVSQCFSVNGNIFNPEAFGVEGLMHSYQIGVNQIKFHGPSAFAPAIRFVSKMALSEQVSQSNQFYIIMTIITNGGLSDMESTIDAIVAASDIPLSIIIIGVGDGDFSKMDILDADEEPLVNSKGKVQSRDIVQFVPFRKYQGNIPEFAREVLEEIPKQIKEFFENQGIVPKDLKSHKKNIKRDVELLKRKRKQEKQKLENPYLKQQREQFIADLQRLGFELDDIEMIIKKGLFSEDKNVAVDMLSQLKTNPEILKEEKQQIQLLKLQRKEEEEKRKKNEEDMKKFTDKRKKFKIEMPLLTPEGFKPLQKHQHLCKICYESKIDSVIVPCGHKLFCVECAKYVKKQCPICLQPVEKVVKEFNVNNYVEKVRQL